MPFEWRTYRKDIGFFKKIRLVLNYVFQTKLNRSIIEYRNLKLWWSLILFEILMIVCGILKSPYVHFLFLDDLP
jgi:hypothetical protein